MGATIIGYIWFRDEGSEGIEENMETATMVSFPANRRSALLYSALQVEQNV